MKNKYFLTNRLFNFVLYFLQQPSDKRDNFLKESQADATNFEEKLKTESPGYVEARAGDV